MSQPSGIDPGFPMRSLRTNLIAGGMASLFAAQYLGPYVGLGLAVGVALGSLHVFTWTGLGRQILGPRDRLWIAVYLLIKLGGVYGGAVLYLMHPRARGVAFLVGFSLIFLVMIQKVLGQKIVAQQRLRSVS